MTRRRSSTMLWVALTLVPFSGLVSCASTGGDVPPAAPAPSASAAPAKKPFEPPTWPATEWKDDTLGFSVHYPSDFAEQPAQPGGLFTAASPAQVPRIDIVAGPKPSEASLDAVAAGIEATMAGIGGGAAKVISKKEVKLADGATDAMEMVVEWSFQGFPLQSLVIATLAGDRMINVMVTGMQGGALDELSEIAYTLYFR